MPTRRPSVAVYPLPVGETSSRYTPITGCDPPGTTTAGPLPGYTRALKVMGIMVARMLAQLASTRAHLVCAGRGYPGWGEHSIAGPAVLRLAPAPAQRPLSLLQTALAQARPGKAVASRHGLHRYGISDRLPVTSVTAPRCLLPSLEALSRHRPRHLHLLPVFRALARLVDRS